MISNFIKLDQQATNKLDQNCIIGSDQQTVANWPPTDPKLFPTEKGVQKFHAKERLRLHIIFMAKMRTFFHGKIDRGLHSKLKWPFQNIQTENVQKYYSLILQSICTMP